MSRTITSLSRRNFHLGYRLCSFPDRAVAGPCSLVASWLTTTNVAGVYGNEIVVWNRLANLSLTRGFIPANTSLTMNTI